MGSQRRTEIDGLTIVTYPEGDPPTVRAGVRAAALEASGDRKPEHDCGEFAVPYVSDGPLGHGWECGYCGAFLQAG